MPDNRDYKAIRKEGGSRVVSLNRWLPPDWQLVLISVVAEDLGRSVTLKFTRSDPAESAGDNALDDDGPDLEIRVMS